jgi:hypothetical protein
MGKWTEGLSCTTLISVEYDFAQKEKKYHGCPGNMKCHAAYMPGAHSSGAARPDPLPKMP